jgi:hypothetical protein
MHNSAVLYFFANLSLNVTKSSDYLQSQLPKQGKHQKPHRNKLYQGRSRGGYSDGEPASTDDLT